MSPLEPDLETLHQHPTPDPAFAARLQRDLGRAERLETPAPQPARLPPVAFPPGRACSAAPGPPPRSVRVDPRRPRPLRRSPTCVGQHPAVFPVRAGGRLCGFGKRPRPLSAPVAVEREGITFIVTQVIATTDRTLMPL